MNTPQRYGQETTPDSDFNPHTRPAPCQSRPRVGVKILVCRYFLPINHSALPRGLLAITYWSFISPMVYILIPLLRRGIYC